MNQRSQEEILADLAELELEDDTSPSYNVFKYAVRHIDLRRELHGLPKIDRS